MNPAEVEERTTLNLIFLGHVDAGKSTLMGRLLLEMGHVDQKTAHRNKKEAEDSGKASFAYAWVLDERPDERARGVTMDVAQARFQTPNFNVVLLDAPGHREYVPKMIIGAMQADAAIVVVDGSVSGFESGFREPSAGFRTTDGGQTREHIVLGRGLGIEQIAVVVTKLDTCQYSQERFEEIREKMNPFLVSWYKNTPIQWIITSALAGINITQPVSSEPLLEWYTGPTLLQTIDSFSAVPRSNDGPLRIPIMALAQSRALGDVAISGKVECGSISIGTTVTVVPACHNAVVKMIEVDGKKRDSVEAGEICDVGLSGLERTSLEIGGVLCTAGQLCSVTARFQCRIGVLNNLTLGLPLSIHVQAACVSGYIQRVVAGLRPKLPETQAQIIRSLKKSTEVVVEVLVETPLCVEEYAVRRPLGSVVLRHRGKTVALGIVLSVLDEK